ncbi:MAG: hypothetical protein JST14_18900 [Bacteroidetes bacterium]|nr:hypothetical protein [Bacteroidota bacterium]MBS1975821.1 hypothetical protein [Bacteroidota bacterium]
MSTNGRPLEQWKILLVGNNPMEMSMVQEKLKSIRHKTVLTEMAFDALTVYERIGSFVPEHVLIDDNVGRASINEMIMRMKRPGRVPVTVLKNSNYEEVGIWGVSNYVMKHNLTSQHLYLELLNSQRFVQTITKWGRMQSQKKGTLSGLLRFDSRVQILW